MHRFLSAILLLFLGLVFAIALSAPITWIERRGVRRGWATAIVVTAVAAVIVGLGWLIVPRIGEQATDLVEAMPALVTDIRQQVASWLHEYPDLRDWVQQDGKAFSALLSGGSTLFTRFGRISLTLVSAVFVTIAVASVTVYIAAKPRPLIEGYLRSLPERHRAKGEAALSEWCDMIVGWMRANVIVGSIEAILAGVFLTWMNVPAPLVWASFTFFAEFIPKLGPYVMAVPPVLMALAVGPSTALWVAVFYIAMNELLGDIVVPYVRGSTMDLHPAVTLAFAIAMAFGFGLLGALIATPAAAFATAYYRAFYLDLRPGSPDTDDAVERVLSRSRS